MGEERSFAVLVVDDDADLREVIITNLELVQAKLMIVQASNGQEAITKMLNQSFDLLITDLNMPKMGGKDLLGHIQVMDKKQKPKNVMVVSGNIEKNVIKKETGKISMLQKPFDMKVFRDYVESVLLRPKKGMKAVDTTSFDVEYINPFIEATLEVLKVTGQIEAQKDFLFIREDSDMMGDITAIVPINSDKYMGSMAITFDQNIYLSLLEKMLGEKYDKIDDDNKDGVAEICNQVYARAKVELNKKGYNLQMAIPTIIHGRQHKVSHSIGGTVLAVMFNSEIGDFLIETIIKPR